MINFSIGRSLLVVSLAAVMTGCAVFKVESQAGDRFQQLARAQPDALKVAQVTPDLTQGSYPYPEGFQCFEPYLFAVTLGLVPAHCIERCEATVMNSDAAPETAEYTVTSMQGWFMVFLAPLPQWKVGYGFSSEDEFRESLLEELNEDRR